MKCLSKILFYLGILLADLIIGISGNSEDNNHRDEVAVEHNTPKKELVKINEDLTSVSNL